MLFYFFFNDTATTEIYTLSLHDALPIYGLKDSKQALGAEVLAGMQALAPPTLFAQASRLNFSTRLFNLLVTNVPGPQDRKSTRLNSSHANISYAVFCLKKKKIKQVGNH